MTKIGVYIKLKSGHIKKHVSEQKEKAMKKVRISEEKPLKNNYDYSGVDVIT